MRWTQRSVAAFAIVIACAAIALGARAKKATYSVELGPAGWRADAIATALRADLADGSLRLATGPVPAELTIKGELAGDTLRYTIIRYGAPLRGSIALTGLDRRALAGVLRDQLHTLVRPHDDVTPGAPADIGAPSAAGLVLFAVLAAILVVPVVLARRVVPKTWRTLRMLRGTVIGLAGIGVAALVILVLGSRVPEASGFVMLGGGLAWGAFAAVVFPIAFPVLGGLGRIEHAQIGPVLRTWTLLAAQRVLGVAVALVVIGLALWGLGALLGVPAVITFGIVAPIVGLLVRHVRRAIVEVLAERLDAVLVDGDATTAQPWHPEVRGYFVGYLRRANLDVDHTRLDGVRFLPGNGDAVHVYGGGLTHTRIVIGRALLELALAPYGRPHDYPMPRVSTLHWTHWNAGLVMPTEAGEKLATKEQRKPAETVEEGEHERIALGEPPTMTGIIEPVELDGRTSYRPGEDPLWLDWDPGEEFDGTDAGDKDFLFGVIVHAFGMIERHEDRGATLRLAWAQWRPQTKLPTALLDRQTDALADAYTALDGAGHHLVQYLGWRLWRREDLLTPRAFVPELERTSRAIYAALDTQADVDEVDRVWRTRLAGLRMWATGAPPKRSQRQRLAFATAVLAGVAVAAVLVVRAVLYHPVYEQRMAQQQNERPTDGK